MLFRAIAAQIAVSGCEGEVPDPEAHVAFLCLTAQMTGRAVWCGVLKLLTHLDALGADDALEGLEAFDADDADDADDALDSGCGSPQTSPAVAGLRMF